MMNDERMPNSRYSRSIHEAIANALNATRWAMFDTMLAADDVQIDKYGEITVEGNCYRLMSQCEANDTMRKTTKIGKDLYFA
jgi:hypothetical protein